MCAHVMLGCSVAVSLMLCGLVGCRPSPDESPGGSPAPESSDAQARPDTPEPEAPDSEASMLAGRYDAISSTASAITGELVLTADRLTFQLDQVYVTRLVGRIAAAQDYARDAGSWSDLLLVPASSEIELRRVSSEKVGPQAPNKGLCEPAKTTFVGLTLATDSTGQPVLALAAFNGDNAPGPAANAGDLCGTFRYGPAGVVFDPLRR